MSLAKLELVLEAIDRATGPISKVDRALDKIERTAQRSSGTMGRLGDVGAKAMRAIGTATVAAGLTIGAGLSYAGSEAMAYEQVVADANKTLALQGEALEDFKASIRTLDLPMEQMERWSIAAEIGRQGIKDQADVLAAVQDAAVMAKAFEIVPATAAQYMGSWRETMQLTQDGIVSLADKINWWGNSTAANEAALADYMTTVGGIGKEAGVAEELTLALGGAMNAAGRQADVASTGFRSFLATMTGGALNTSSAQMAAWDKLNLDPDALAQQMITDAEGAMRQVITAIDAMPEWEQASIGNKIFGDEAFRAMGPLLSDATLFEQTMARMREAAGSSGAMYEEFTGATDTARGDLDAFLADLKGFVAEVGTVLLPSMRDGIGALRDMLRSIDVEALKARITAVFEAIDAGIDRVILTLTTAKIYLAEFWEGLAPAAGSFADAGLAEAATLLEPLNAALEGLLATLSGFGNAVGTTLVDYFKGYFAGLEPYLQPMVERLSGIWNQLGPILENFGRIGTAIGGMFDAIGANEGAMSAVESFGRIMGELAGISGNIVLTGIEGLLRWIETITGVMAALYNGEWTAMKTEISEFVDWLNNLSFADIIPDFTGWISGNNDAAEAVRAHQSALADFAGDAGAAIAKLNELSQVERNKVKFDAGEGLAAAQQRLQKVQGELDNIANPFGFWEDWDLGAKLNEQLGTGEIALADYQAQLEAAMAAGGDYAEKAGDMLAKSFDFAAAEADLQRFQQTLANVEAAAGAVKAAVPANNNLPATAVANDNVAAAVPDVAAPTMPSIDTVRAAQGEVDALNAAIAATTAAGNALPAAIAASLQSVRAAVASVDLTSEGIRIMQSLQSGLTTGGLGAAGVVTGTMAQISAAATLDLTAKGMSIMDTLAAGMRARAHAVVDEIRKVTQQVRDHLPSSPARTGPLSDLHRLKFMETIASSVRAAPLVDAVERATAQARGAMNNLPIAEPVRRAPIGMAGSAGASTSSAGGATTSIDASVTIQGDVHYGTVQDKQEFEALLRRHSRTVAEVVGRQERLARRTQF